MEDLVNKKQTDYKIPGAIILAGFLIAVAVFSSSGEKQIITETDTTAPEAGSLELVIPITENDHVFGNPNAPVKIVEYSDLECPFCKRFDTTMTQIMSEYGKDGRVAWVYRHFPLDQLHPVKARKEAVASECANELGGNSAFWQFIKRFFELTPSNNQTDIDTVLPQIAREIGLNESEFQACLDSGKYDKHVQDEYNNAVATGGTGTPWSIVVAENGKKFPVNGAVPYQNIKQLIDIALQEIN